MAGERETTGFRQAGMIYPCAGWEKRGGARNGCRSSVPEVIPSENRITVRRF